MAVCDSHFMNFSTVYITTHCLDFCVLYALSHLNKKIKETKNGRTKHSKLFEIFIQ